MELLVTKFDGSTENVQIQQLTISQIRALAIAVENDEAAEIALFTGRPKEWADTLTVESAEAIITEGERINADPLVRWHERQMKKLERFNPELAAKIKSGSLPN